MEKNQRRSLIIIAVLFVGIVCAVGQYMGAFNAMYALATNPNPGHTWNQMECSTGLCVDTVNNRVGVGTTSPTSTLHVVGGFKVGSHTTCDSSTGAWNFTTPVSVPMPTEDSNAATKGYVDSCVHAITNCGTSFTDPRDGKIYPTVLLGCQCWMAKNMGYDEGFYPNGNSANVATYGMLYYSVDITGICPSGWHIPSLEEYGVLENTIGSMNDAWMDPNGWAAVFAGYYDSSSYRFFGSEAYYITTSKRSSDNYRWIWRLSESSPYNNVMPVYQEAYYSNFFSVRCLMD